jgi:hypothetical protein
MTSSRVRPHLLFAEDLPQQLPRALGDEACRQASFGKQETLDGLVILIEDLIDRWTEGAFHTDAGDAAQVQAAAIVEQDEVRGETPRRIGTWELQDIEQDMRLPGLTDPQLDLGRLELDQIDGSANRCAQPLDLSRVIDTGPDLFGVVVGLGHETPDGFIFSRVFRPVAV